ncbi:MAG TPA: DJ-1/PfpI family protein [Acidimicrobiales bacterium]|nr:DJ-1/PfpI family protein [Acidimicrobiales bacterium]
MRAGLVVFDGVEELDAIAPYEVLRLGAKAGGDVSCRLLHPRGGARVRASHGLEFATDGPLEEGLDVVVVPGGGWVGRGATGAWAEAERGDWLEWLAAAQHGGALVASVCTGALLVARAGLAAGRRMATHHLARADLAALGAVVVEERVVDDGDLVSCGGVTSGIDLALWLLERECSAALATAVADEIEYRPERPHPR